MSELGLSPQEARLFGIFERKGVPPTVAVLYRYVCGNVKSDKRTDREKHMRVGAIVARVNKKLAKFDRGRAVKRQIIVDDGRFSLKIAKKKRNGKVATTAQ